MRPSDETAPTRPYTFAALPGATAKPARYDAALAVRLRRTLRDHRRRADSALHRGCYQLRVAPFSTATGTCVRRPDRPPQRELDVLLVGGGRTSNDADRDATLRTPASDTP